MVRLAGIIAIGALIALWNGAALAESATPVALRELDGEVSGRPLETTSPRIPLRPRRPISYAAKRPTERFRLRHRPPANAARRCRGPSRSPRAGRRGNTGWP